MLKRKLYLMDPILVWTSMLVLITCSATLNIYRVYKKDTEPSLQTWLLLFLISLSMLVSYASSSGARENILILLLELIEPAVVFFLILHKAHNRKMSDYEKLLMAITISIIVLWSIANYALHGTRFANTLLFLAVITEALALADQFIKNCLHGDKDRPMHWIMSGVGYLMSICLVPEISLPNLSLPFLGILYLVMAIPLMQHCLIKKIPFKKWF